MRITAGFLFVSGIALVFGANCVAYLILEEVNERRSPERQYPLMLMPFFTVWADHEHLFPQSRRRLNAIILFLAGLACGLPAVCIGAFAP
jgi:hypothetical protein